MAAYIALIGLLEVIMFIFRLIYFSYPLKRQSRPQQTTNFVTSFLIFEKNEVLYLIFLKKPQNSKFSSAINYRWHFMGYFISDFDGVCRRLHGLIRACIFDSFLSVLLSPSI